MAKTKSNLGLLLKQGDLWLILGIFGTVLLLIFPVSPVLLDLLLTISIALSLLILLVILIPLMVMGGYFSGFMTGQQPGMATQLMWAALGFVIFVLVQGYPLSQSGQTWGKKALKMKIVDLDGRQPSFATLIAKRYLPVQAISAVPVVGGLFGLVNVLFIFREDRRCIHDLIAGTQVVVAD